MKKTIEEFSNELDFVLCGASYAGAPRDNTMMYIGKKVEYLIDNLYDVTNCLVFIQDNIDVPQALEAKHFFVLCSNPQMAYAEYAGEFNDKMFENEKKLQYTLTAKGYYVGENVEIGENSYIEPGVLIGHNVKIGLNAVILSGAKIKKAIIGDNFLCNENAVIGNNCFTMAKDQHGKLIRIPALGRVIIGDNVEVGACDDVAAGACGDTVLKNNVKLDSLVHIGHEAILEESVEVTAGAVVGGFAHIGDGTFVGINSTIKNRLDVGQTCIIGMGSNVTKSVDDTATVVGNPAKKIR